MKNEERKIPRTGALRALRETPLQSYVTASSIFGTKNTILRCIMRKAFYMPTEVYWAYMRVGYKWLDKIRRSIAHF